MNNDFLYGSICLSDIPKELIRKSEKNGKYYVNIGVSQLREKSKYGDTHVISSSVPKDQRHQNEKPAFIGNLKTWEGSKNNPTTTKQPEDDLPF